MALTILQQPTSVNVSGTNLLYTISSSIVPEFQYRYVVDIYESGSSTRLTRLKYPENLNGTANIDLGRVLDDYLDTNYAWKANIIDISSEPSKVFTIQFGEEYANSYTGPVTTYPNIVSSSIQVLKGNIQYPSLGNYNPLGNVRTTAASSINFNRIPYTYINSSSRFCDQTLTNNPNLLNELGTSKYWEYEPLTVTGITYAQDLYLSASKGFYAAQPIGTNDYATETYIDNTPGNNTGVTAYLSLFNDNNELIWESNLCSEGNTVAKYRPVIDNLKNEPPGTLTLGTGLLNMGACLNNVDLTGSLGDGPLSASISSSDQWNWYQIGVYADNQKQSWAYHFYYNEDKGPDTLLSVNSSSMSAPFNRGNWTEFAMPIRPGLWANKHYPTYCNNEKTRFAFVNSFGAWDYYNVYMPTRRVTNIDRQTYYESNIKLQQQITTYNVSDRGETQYYTEYTDDFEITTDTLDSQQSQWLRELFESDDVYIQSGSNFIPIIITNSSEQLSNNTYRNKNFRYTIRYQFSNLREPR